MGKDGKVIEAEMRDDQVAVMQACLSGAKFVNDKAEEMTSADRFAAIQSAVGFGN